LRPLALGLQLQAVARRVPVGTHGHLEGAILTMVPNSFALQDFLILALAPKSQAAARHVPMLMKMAVPPVQGMRGMVPAVRRVRVRTHGRPEGVGMGPRPPPSRFALQDLWTMAQPMQCQAVARRAPVDTHGYQEGACIAQIPQVLKCFALQDLLIKLMLSRAVARHRR
jgi:hypothetical protein